MATTAESARIRKRLLELAESDPDAPLTDIARAAGVPYNVAYYHLVRKEGMAFLSPGTRGRPQKPGGRHVRRAARLMPDATVSELAAAAGVSYATAYQALDPVDRARRTHAKCRAREAARSRCASWAEAHPTATVREIADGVGCEKRIVLSVLGRDEAERRARLGGVDPVTAAAIARAARSRPSADVMEVARLSGASLGDVFDVLPAGDVRARERASRALNGRSGITVRADGEYSAVPEAAVEGIAAAAGVDPHEIRDAILGADGRDDAARAWPHAYSAPVRDEMLDLIERDPFVSAEQLSDLTGASGSYAARVLRDATGGLLRG